MELHWNIHKDDIKRIKDFVAQHKNPFVERVIVRNVQRQNILLDKDTILRNILMCLVTSQQKSGPNTRVGMFLNLKPFPISYQLVSKSNDIEKTVQQVLVKNGLNRYINKIPSFFAHNFHYLQKHKWKIVSDIETNLNGTATKETERKFADHFDEVFKGFGPKQSRNFLQALGLTKYEVPIDSRITSWLNEFGFPVTLSSGALQDRAYYHFVSDGFQILCEQADIYPCVLDATIFSSFDNGEWTDGNIVY